MSLSLNKSRGPGKKKDDLTGEAVKGDSRQKHKIN